MHNSLKYFRASSQGDLVGQMEQFMTDSNVSGKSISVDGDGNDFVALLGYLPGNEANIAYSITTRDIGNNTMNAAQLQQNIDAVTAEMGNFICQCIIADGGKLAIAFLLGK